MSETPHDLKCWPEFFSEILAGRKTFEIRKDDRGFKVGDVLRLLEYLPGVKLTGREARYRVSYLTAWEQQPGYVVMAIRPIGETTHDLTQRAEAITQRMVNLEGSEHQTSLHDLLDVQDMLRDLSAALVQAEQRTQEEGARVADVIAVNEILTRTISDLKAKLVQAEQEKAGWKDSYTVDMGCLQMRLATQEATIRQVEQAIVAIADQLVNDEPNLARELGGLADTLLAILRAE